MKSVFEYRSIPRSRVATIDVYSIGVLRHHVAAILEFDVTNSRRKIRELRRKGEQVSFTAWLIKVISHTIQKHPEVAAYKWSHKKLITFNDINVSILIEKVVSGKRVPIAMVIEKAHEKSISRITSEIEDGKRQNLGDKDAVINRQSEFWERMYFRLPGIIRRGFWRFLLRNPKIAYRYMGNVVVTSLGMVGRLNGWFIHKTLHPVSFGIGAIIQKPLVINDEIKKRDVLNMTVLLDHDVVDGAPMVRFLNDLTKSVEKGIFL